MRRYNYVEEPRISTFERQPLNKSMLREFLIYIPCHSDFELALKNAGKIRTQVKELKSKPDSDDFEIYLVMSVNGTGLSHVNKREIMESCDELIYFHDSLGGDTNINQGFLKALERQPDYFWILSANENLVDGAIGKILERIAENPLADLFVTNARNRTTNIKIENIFLDVEPGTALGLISGVIYNFSTTRMAFSAGPRFAWTGWGQLAVIQSASTIKGELEISQIPDYQVYEKPFTDLKSIPRESEFEVVRSGYAHSFFGMVFLICSLFPADTKIQKKVLYQWLKSNWFKLRYFRVGAVSRFDPGAPQLNSIWVQEMAIKILYRQGIRMRLLTFIGLNFEAEHWKSNKFALRVKTRFLE